jgi:ribonuclease HI
MSTAWLIAFPNGEALLMVLEHCIAALKDVFTDIKILSDSQSAVGILTLNWKSSNYIDTISDIKENLGTLMRYGIRTTLSWIPGHANIAGNEIADQLAKEAAKEKLCLSVGLAYLNGWHFQPLVSDHKVVSLIR